jgi:hypothetical protein
MVGRVATCCLVVVGTSLVRIKIQVDLVTKRIKGFKAVQGFFRLRSES